MHGQQSHDHAVSRLHSAKQYECPVSCCRQHSTISSGVRPVGGPRCNMGNQSHSVADEWGEESVGVLLRSRGGRNVGQEAFGSFHRNKRQRIRERNPSVSSSACRQQQDKAVKLSTMGFDFDFVYWHLILVTPDGPRFRSTFLPRLPLAMVVLF